MYEYSVQTRDTELLDSGKAVDMESISAKEIEVGTIVKLFHYDGGTFRYTSLARVTDKTNKRIYFVKA